MPSAPDSEQRLTYDFGFAARYEHVFLPAHGLYAARNEPALYAWYCRVHPHARNAPELEHYRALHGRPSLTVHVSSTLGEEFAGRLDRATPAAAWSPDRELLMTASAVFAPPIYIGMSTRLHDRLAEHLRALEAVLTSGVAASAAPGATPVDTADESRTFGQRVGALLRAAGVGDTRSLYVKAVYAPPGPDRAALLRGVESFLNRTYLPVAGRL